MVEGKGLFCAPYTAIRCSHFWLMPKVGGAVDRERVTRLGLALRERVGMIPAYPRQARRRSERDFGTWQGRLPQELRLRAITTVEATNRFLRDEYIAEFKRRFLLSPAQAGVASFTRCRQWDLEQVFSLRFKHPVNRDNTVSFQNLFLVDSASTLASDAGWVLAGYTMTVHQHLDCTLSLRYGHMARALNG